MVIQGRCSNKSFTISNRVGARMGIPAPGTHPCISRLLKDRFCSSWKGRNIVVLSCNCRNNPAPARSRALTRPVPGSQVTLSQEQQFSPFQFSVGHPGIENSLAMSRSALLSSCKHPSQTTQRHTRIQHQLQGFPMALRPFQLSSHYALGNVLRRAI